MIQLTQSPVRNNTSRMQKIIEEMTNSEESAVPMERHSSNLEVFLQKTKSAFRDGHNLAELPEELVTVSSSESASLANDSSL